MRNVCLLWAIVSGLGLVSTGRAQDRPLFRISTRTDRPAPSSAPDVPLDALPPGLRERVASVLERPALTAKGPSETFNARPETYRWLLDHPQVGVRLWRQLGAKVADINDRGDGVFQWKDDNGSQVDWHIGLRTANLVLWYAEGKIKPSPLLPTTAFRAVAVLHYTTGNDTTGKPAVRHQVHFHLRCDSAAVALAARLLGASAPRMAEQYLGQLQVFYGGMAWYLDQDEDRARQMFARAGLFVPAPPEGEAASAGAHQ